MNPFFARSHKHLIFSLALSLILTASARGDETTIFSTGFESTETPAYVSGHVLNGYNGWTVTPLGIYTPSAQIFTGQPQTGSQAMFFATSDTTDHPGFFSPNLAAPLATAIASGQTTITSSASFAMHVGGDGSVLTLKIADPNSINKGGIATMNLVYDPNFATDTYFGSDSSNGTIMYDGTNDGISLPSAFSVVVSYNNGQLSDDGDGFIFYENVAKAFSAGLPDNTFASGKDVYFNFSIIDDLANQQLTFNLNGQTIYTAPAYSNTLSNVAIGGNTFTSDSSPPTAQSEIDNYSVTATSPVPEPSTWALLFFGATALALSARRKA